MKLVIAVGGLGMRLVTATAVGGGLGMSLATATAGV